MVSARESDREMDLEKAQTSVAGPQHLAYKHHAPHGFANPKPMGLLGFATSIFLISLFNLQPNGVHHPNIIIAAMIFFGGIVQMISGIFEIIIGETFPATVFCSFASFNLSYALIYLPGSGIIESYTDPATGLPTAELGQALAFFVWAWFILCVIYTIAAVRTSWTFLALFVFVDLTLLLTAVGHQTNNESIIYASSATGFVTAALTYWAGASFLMGDGLTPFNLPLGLLEKTE